ncbi:MAG: ABC transporter ATP-binding protein [Drouetiella hepatica Uher 2000/2452]|jgi:spermidine/putrescine transport system ATP-binding protein|uniref:Spermidine/putrescine import ATP-binding protein PotA n=1 Tax=Drouetiella hepatica Uher 2000/2452 TaxID=904376 RepID=A0A951ULW0_9CYAN|nr:ABC transporter ATP-binding protein [Drouetiella hepatica Uher 2000/2452]
MSQTATRDQSVSKTDTRLDVELRKVFKVYNGETAVRGIDLDIHQGEFFSILGPSGCGKTTTLRMIAGFEDPSGGEVMIRGKSMVGVPPYKRPVNTVFQSYALFGHLTVWDNVAFSLRLKSCGNAELRERVGDALRLVKMSDFARRFPAQLSGGQQQRVALARALVNHPTVLLLDEPLGALDLKLRKEMQTELSHLHRELGLTFVMVTHDQEEALSLSDRIAVMNNGKIEQIGTPSEIYEHPQTAFVADFIGDTNLLKGRIESIHAETLQIVTDSGLRILAKPKTHWNGSNASEAESPNSDASEAFISIRPEKVHCGLSAPADSINCYEGKLKHVMYLGTHISYQVDLETGDRITVLQPNRSSLMDLGTSVYVYWAAEDCLALAPQE